MIHAQLEPDDRPLIQLASGVSAEDLAECIKKAELMLRQEHNWHNPLIVHVSSASTEDVAPLTSQMFEDAVEHINTHGWTQGRDMDEAGRVCAQGAFTLWRQEVDEQIQTRRVIFDHARFRTFRYHVTEVMDLMGICFDLTDIVSWNDAAGRTREQVVDALTKAAKALRDQGR